MDKRVRVPLYSRFSDCSNNFIVAADRRRPPHFISLSLIDWLTVKGRSHGSLRPYFSIRI